MIAVGYGELGNISELSRQELEGAIRSTYGDSGRSSRWIIRSIDALWTFWHEIDEGDVIIAKKGRHHIAAFGTVTQTAFYDEERGHERVQKITVKCFPNFLGVDWHESPRDIECFQARIPGGHQSAYVW